MANTNISIRVDEDIKKAAEDLFAKLGLTLSAATNVFYRQAVLNQGIPFILSAAPAAQTNTNGGTLLREALREAQEHAAATGTSEMSLDEINAIVAEVRHEYRGANETSSN